MANNTNTAPLIRRNYREDFTLLLRLTDAEGEAIAMQGADFTLAFFTASPSMAFTASCRAGAYSNCRLLDTGEVQVIFDNHRLSPGALHCNLTLEIEDATFPDGTRRVFRPVETGAVLTRDISDFSDAVIEVQSGMLRGRDMTYSDLTPEQIAELQRPATVAAETLTAGFGQMQAEVEGVNAAAREAETSRVAAESSRAVAEAERAEAETLRAEAEGRRVASEDSRIEGENLRAQAESFRIAQSERFGQSEQLRSSAETARATAETSRAQNETNREVAEAARADAERSRADSELVRSSAESVRVAKEQERQSAEAARQTAETARNAAAESFRQSEQRLTSSEASRVSAEQARATAEGQRATAESGRVSAEQQRASAEQQRKSAETTRASEFATAIASVANKQTKLTVSDKLSLTEAGKLDLTDKAKLALFIDLWNSACGTYGKYNSTTGFFELNGLTDITYKQAVEIYTSFQPSGIKNESYTRPIRTNIPPRSFRGDSSARAMFWNTASELEVAILTNNGWVNNVGLGLSDMSSMFRDCSKLVEVKTNIGLPNSVYMELAFANCIRLRTINVASTNVVTVPFQDCKSISKASIEYAINNLKTGSTIRVHADVMAKLTGDTANAACAALTDEERTQWADLLTLATSKNIQFATA